MTSPALPFFPHKKAQEAIVAFYQECLSSVTKQYALREMLRNIDLAYMREIDRTEDTLKTAYVESRGDPTKFRNMILPVIMPQVESAVAYQASVFLSGYPLFSTVTRPGLEDVALQMDAVIEDQQVRGDWYTEFTQSFRDGFKYNLMGVEVDWKKRVSYAPDGAAGMKELMWQGNSVRRLDMYNTFWDTRVAPRKVASDGEFAGYIELMSRIQLKKFLAELPYRMNVTEAFESGVTNSGGYVGTGGYEHYYLPELNLESGVLGNSAELRKDTNWLAWAGIVDDHRRPSINYGNSFTVQTIYGRILPSDFGFRGVPGANIPQVWKFILVNGKIVVYAEKLTNAHDLLPMLFAQPLDDGLTYQTKSYAQNLAPIQSITSAVANLSIAARRRSVADRMLYDSARISAGHINNDQPAARIPVKPSVSGQPLSAAVYQLPFEDGQFQHNQAELQGYLTYGNMITGLNPARQGQFVKGNKTRFEFAEVMGNANSRDQLISLGLEGSYFTPIKEILKVNILQYQPQETILSAQTRQEVSVDPVELREAIIAFKLSDGLNPADKMIDGQTFEGALQVISQSPQLAAEYNLGPAFSYLMKSRGADISAFEKSPQQVAYEQAMQQWQMAMAQLAESLKGMEPEAMQQALQAAPPQPKPEDYNYDPAQPKAVPAEARGGTQGGSILDQAVSAISEQTQAGEAGQGGVGEVGS